MDGRREKMFSARVSDFEHELLHRAADINDVSASQWAREVLLDEARDEVRGFLDRISDSAQAPSVGRETEPAEVGE